MNLLYRNRFFCLLLIPVFSLGLFSQAAGTLDTQFGTNGSVQLPFLTFPSDCRAMTVQTDGKIILAGQYLSGGLGNMALARFNSNGTIDNTFGASGKAIIPFNNGNVTVVAVRMLTGGKIMIGGNSDGKPVLVRLNANGTVDNTFGTSGQVAFDGDLNALVDLAVASDGKLVGCGIADQGAGKLFCALRRNADGSADNTFGTNGFAYVNVGGQPSVTRLAIQADGKVLLTGTVYTNASTVYDLVLFRFNANGTPDAGFGTNGKVSSVLGVNSAYEQGNAIAVQLDGKIVVAGRIANAGPTVYVVVRYNANGSIDSGFGTSGSTKFGFYNSVDEAKAVAVQADGKIVVAGTVINGSNREIGLARLTKTGALDTGFGTAGKTTTAIGTKVFGDAMLLQSDSKILVAGSATVSNLSQYSVARYHAGSVTGIFEPTAGLERLEVFPNPAAPGSALQLRFELEENLSCRIQLLAIDGRLLTSYAPQNLTQGAQTLELLLPDNLPAGQLLLRVETERGVQAVPVLVRN